MVSIPRIITKPSAPLNTEAEHAIFTNRLTNSKVKDSVIINLTIIQLNDGNNKENEPDKDSKKKTKDVEYLGNLKKTANVQELQKHWACEKKQPNCMGTYCYIFDDGSHLPLSNTSLECWAFAMVCRPHPRVVYCSLYSTDEG